MTSEEFIKLVKEFFDGTAPGEPYQSNAIKRVGLATKKYLDGKFDGKI